jgi:NADH:ubiquinone oxidoreductase subunit 2 (subunit N)
MAGLAIALHHLVVKPTLFLLAERWGGSLDQLAGAARRSPIGAALFVLFALSLLGVPPLPGFWAKYLLLTALAAQPAGIWWLAGFVVLLTTAVEATYLFRFIGALYRRAGPADAQTGYAVAGGGVFAATLIAAALAAPLLAAPFGRMASQMADTAAYVARVLPAPAQSGVAP